MKKFKVLDFSQWSWVKIILVVITFQLFLSWLLWRRVGNIPPNFDDAYAYIFAIQKFVEQKKIIPYVPYLHPSAHFDYLGYSVLMGTLASVLGVSAFNLFYSSFFWGKILLVLTIVLWSKKWFSDRQAKLAVLFVGLFIGDGAIHGFFWVTPSFFSVIFCLWMVYVIAFLKPNIKSLVLSFVLGSLAVSFHPLSYVILATLWVWLIYLKINKLEVKNKMIVFIPATLAMLSFALIHQLFSLKEANMWIDPSGAAVRLRLINASGSFVHKSWRDIANQGAKLWWTEFGQFWFWMFPILFSFNKLTKSYSPRSDMIISLIKVSTIISFLVSLFLEPGFRLLIWIWVLAYTGLAILWFRKKEVVTRFTIALFILFHLSWNMVGIWQSTKQNDYWWSLDCVAYLKQETNSGDPLYFTSQSGISAFAAEGLMSRKLLPITNIDQNENLLVIRETEKFDGMSDIPFASLLELEKKILLKTERPCGFFEVARAFRRSY